MKPLKSILLIALCASIVLTTFSATSLAITGNSQPDSTPYVCIVVLFEDAERTQAISYSTGILLSPTVVLTAGHSVMGIVESGKTAVAASVCFDQEPIPFTMEPNGDMYYTTEQPIYNGRLVPYPEFAASVIAGFKPSEVLQTSDVGLIILDTPVQEVTTYATLPTPDLAESLSVRTPLKVIGYSVQFQVSPQGDGLYAWEGSVSRKSATVELLSTNFQGSSNYLKCTANAAQGKGGTAFGDSGGPVMYDNNGQSVVLAVNAYVSNVNCAGVTYHTRLDNSQVLSWISEYL